MAMVMRGEVALPVDRLTVWTKLNDPVALKNCIGVIRSLDRTGANDFAFTVRVTIGPMGVTFRGKIALSDVDPPTSYRINAEGEGGIAGGAGGFADVVLTDRPDGTLLAYAVQVNLGGRLAKMGARVVDRVAKTAADRFFAGFAAECLK